MNLHFVFTCLLVSLLAACAIADPAERKAGADGIAAEARMTPLTLETPLLDLHARIRTAGKHGTLVVYIEGDGLAWKRTSERSDDPTPLNPVALRLAAVDPSPAVAWLARPCQFTGGLTARNCNSDLWTNARYSETVIAAIGEALDQLRAESGATKLALVGYSGGGTVAALAAMRRTDIVWLKTVASPLDTEAFTSFHKVSPLEGSLNPADDAASLTRLPQIHDVGENDRIVPPEINRAAAAQFDAAGCAELRVVTSAAHDDGWRDAWPALLRETPACR
ncbi:MAG: hypothetical protein JJ937_13420 [Parvibaculum sp.]|uniref:hypothetical protein n=1 Tax=Parvibaculum sp. TaxID=2024848 RepID=UPI001B262FC5|nr:hypothetical protein [Parvibaculum sp.]MBO6635528.1 hypothetical protein [Parvibaculum sp.]